MYLPNIFGLVLNLNLRLYLSKFAVLAVLPSISLGRKTLWVIVPNVRQEEIAL